jgi:hypothetical protein
MLNSCKADYAMTVSGSGREPCAADGVLPAAAAARQLIQVTALATAATRDPTPWIELMHSKM